jgi:hypothetical protein
MERLKAALKARRPADYTDRTSGSSRHIQADITDPDDLYILDTAFDSFINHVNNVVGPNDDDDEWEIKISLTMVKKVNDKASEKN